MEQQKSIADEALEALEQSPEEEKSGCGPICWIANLFSMIPPDLLTAFLSWF